MRTEPESPSGAGLMLRTVMEHGPLGRSAIARRTGLSPASITRFGGELIARGLLIELPECSPASGIGRPSVPLDLDPAAGVVGAVHYAAKFTTVSLLDVRGGLLAKDSLDHEGDARTVVDRSATALAGLLHAHRDGRPLLGIGVASGGWVDPERGVIVEHDVLGWRHVPVAAVLGRDFGVPVQVDSHVRALIRAEQLFGDPRSRQSVLAVFVGNIVDGAFAVGRQIHQGSRFRAGAIAHQPVAGSREACACGRTGCLQATVSGLRLMQRALDAGVITRPRIRDLAEAAQAGNAYAFGLFLERARIVGRVLAPIVDMLGPELVVVTDAGLTRLPDCLAALRSEIATHSYTVSDPERSVVASSFSGVVPSVAAGAAFLDVLYSDPLSLASLSQAV